MSLRAPKGAWQSYRKVLRLLHFVRNDSFLTLFLGSIAELAHAQIVNVPSSVSKELGIPDVFSLFDKIFGEFSKAFKKVHHM